MRIGTVECSGPDRSVGWDRTQAWARAVRLTARSELELALEAGASPDCFGRLEFSIGSGASADFLGRLGLNAEREELGLSAWVSLGLLFGAGRPGLQ